ncbi:MAG: isochorismatase [Gammaproteobacteria bacterium]|jgi:nicotinamidase-related amidase|nr:isochorismatase [Gammaproteobacteria bacterium]
MLLDAKNCLFLLIDTQENIVNFIHQHEQLIANCRDCLDMAKHFNVPRLASEHCPEKNGLTVAALREIIKPANCFSKIEFSCVASPEGKARLAQYQQQQIILAGVEAHACILQTALDLLSIKKQVYVLSDAVDSRFIEDKNCAIQRMQQLGVQIISKQMLLFELAKNSKHPAFQELSNQMLK